MFEFPSARWRWRLALLNAVALFTPALAGALPTDDDTVQKTAEQLQAVIVTGTHTDSRTASSSLAPVDILTAQALQSTGSSDLGSALAKLEPSLNFPLSAGADGSAAQRSLAMRGLSPDMLLVLVDGKRYHSASYVNTLGVQGYGTAPVDLNTLPLSAVDHIEVLRDGASSQYGSDAIAGVVNIVLKHGARGGAIELGGGQYSAGDGEQYRATADFGIPLGERGWLRLDLENGYTGTINRNQPNSFDADLGTTAAGGTPSIHHHSASLNGAYTFGDRLEGYFYLTNTWRDSTSALNYRYPYLNYRDYNNRQIGNAADGYVGYPEYALYPNGYQPLLRSQTQDNQLVLGLRGTLGDGWRWDVAGNDGRNKLSFDTLHSINRAWYLDTGEAPTAYYDGMLHNQQQIITADVNKVLNVAWLPSSVTLAFGAEYMRESYGIDAGNLDSYYATLRSGSYPDSGVPQAGAQGFGGYTPAAAGAWARHHLAEYLSLETNLTEQWGTALSVRHEDYSDFGNAVNAALSTRYDFTDRVALRGSFSTGFKAPALAQSHYTEVASRPYTVDQGVPVAGLYNTGVFAVNNSIAQLLGAQPLKPEKSKNYSLGLVWRPRDDLSLTADIYQIDIRDRIALSGSIPTLYASVPAYGQAITDFLATHGDSASYASVQYMFNGFNTRSRGFDLVVDHSHTFARSDQLQSTLSFSLNGNRITGYNTPPAALVALQAQFPGVPLVDQLLSRSVVKGIYEHGAPNYKLVWSESYTRKPWTLNGVLTRYGSITRYADAGSAGTLVTPLYPNGINVPFDETYGGKWLLDLAASYDYGNWTFTLGADNIFDTYPDRSNYYNNQTGAYRYSLISPFGFYGRYVYAKLDAHW